ncbi:DUF3800 domain-containing protein [Microbacterium aerolatum]|uniref:DUF3800 domain-containing protein n=1 Tax=Microbacterium aerolatum TaxID=153731 RepID=UPI002001A841|nr:DUF3800 domain-containing protein [Microbacterium aerolatum]MCK3771275.1 DUF3800 domain-containing protein [Microbacterium aerolatum]
MHIEVYCDESRPELFVSAEPSGDLTLIGSLWIPADCRSELKDEVQRLRRKHSVWGEFKWQKVAPSKVDFYHDIVDLFFDAQDMRFRTIVIDADRLDLPRFHGADSELGFYKFYYQLLTHWIHPANEYSVFCDDKVNRDRSRLSTLGRVLSNKHPRADINPIHAVSSSQSAMVQVCDVLLGAAQSRMNRSNRGSAAKSSVLSHIEDRIGHPIAPTVQAESKFNLFKIELRSGVQ